MESKGNDEHEPDLERCRARQAEVSDLAYCLVPLPHSCPWAERHSFQIYCFHSDREKIINQTAPDSAV